jgi:hypothetical protein
MLGLDPMKSSRVEELKTTPMKRRVRTWSG